MRLAVSAAALLLLAGCDSGGLVCTDEFRSVEVLVVDVEGAPVDNLATTITNARTLESIGFRRVVEDGRYTVLSDNVLAFVRDSGDLIRFSGTNDTLVAAAEFTIGRDGCHVQKLDGPDTIVAREETAAP